MGPGNENAGRGEYFRATLGRPGTITALVVGAAAALLAGAYFGGPPAALAAPVGVVVLIVGIAFWLADRKAEDLFWEHVADSLGTRRSTTRPRSRRRRRCCTPATAASGTTS